MAWFAVVVLVAGVVLLAVGRNRARRGRPGAATDELVVDDVGARRSMIDGRREGVDWVDLTRVEVVHARRGPHAEAGGVVMLAGDAARGCLVPLNRIGDSQLLERLAQLPGFDVDRFVRALQDTDGGDIACWVRPGGAGDGDLGDGPPGGRDRGNS